MAIDNWKLWLIPFAVWGLVMTWHSGYQSGYKDGHDTAWEMSRPTIGLIATQPVAMNAEEDPSIKFAAR
jgi:hypothetical protein